MTSKFNSLLNFIVVAFFLLTTGTMHVLAQSDFSQQLIGKWNTQDCTERLEFFSDGTVVFTITATGATYAGDYRVLGDAQFSGKQIRFDIASRGGVETLTNQYLLPQLIGTQVADVSLPNGYISYTGLSYDRSVQITVNGITYIFISSLIDRLETQLTDSWVNLETDTRLAFQQGNSLDIMMPIGTTRTLNYQAVNECQIRLSDTVYSSSTANIVLHGDFLLWYDGTILYRFQRFHAPSTESPLGTIAYLSGDAVYTIDPDTLETRYVIAETGLGNSTYTLKWSPDGSHLILYDGGGSFTGQLYSMDVNTSAIQKISTPDQTAGWMLSPDGMNLLFLSSFMNGSVALNVVGLDGSNQRQLSSLSANYLCCAVLSPDSQHIAFTAKDENGNWGSYIVNVDGSNQKFLTGVVIPSWSPDGQQIAYMSSTNLETSNIFVMNADGGAATQLTNSGTDAEPAWSPDGQQIVFVSRQDGNAELYMMSADGTNQRRLTNTPEDEGYPTWRPTGTSLATTTSQLSPDFSQSPLSDSSAQLADDITHTVANALETVLKNNQSTPKANAILLIQATSDLTSIASEGLSQLDIICSPLTGLTYLQSVLGADFSHNPLYSAGDYICTYGQGYIAVLEALSASSVPFALVPILLQPEKYVDPWLDPINEAAWRFPITCTLFPDASICK